MSGHARIQASQVGSQIKGHEALQQAGKEAYLSGHARTQARQVGSQIEGYEAL